MTVSSEADIRQRPEVEPEPHIAPPNARSIGGALTLPELVVGGFVVVLAVFAWMALLLLHLHVGSLPAVCLATVGALAVLGAAVWWLAPHPAITVDPAACIVLVILAGVAAFFFFPGFPYGVTDKDPGVYVASGAAFAQHDSYSFTDVLGQRVPAVAERSPGARFPGVWVVPGTHTVVPQFYHLWTALLAMAHDVGGLGLEFQIAPFIGVLAVCLFTLLLRRAVPGRASLPAAAIGGLLLTTNMMEVWQAKYPSTEILAQLLVFGVLLGVCIAVSTGWRPAAGAAGLLLGIGWLERPDMLLFVGIAALAGAALVVLRRFDARAWWFTAGFAIVLPHALWQAYAGARSYTLSNDVPTLRKVVLAVLALAIVTVVLRAIRPVQRVVLHIASDRRWQLGLGFALCAVFGALMLFGFVRGRVLGEDYYVTAGQKLRSYNDQNMRRLTWFLTWLAFPLAGIGLAIVALRRWRATLWIAVLPLLITVPVFVARSRVAPRLMWWVRRYVPEVLPAIVILMSIALAAGLVWHYHRRRVLAIPVMIVVAALAVVYAGQSRPLRHHKEFDGSAGVTAAMAAASGHTPGVFLFAERGCCTSPEYLFGGAVWLERGQYASEMPSGPAAADYVRRVAAAMPGHPVFVVSGGRTQPALGSVGLTPAKHITAQLPMWEETETVRPSKPRAPIPVDFTLWRVTGT
jgi:hypothetical protein